MTTTLADIRNGVDAGETSSSISAQIEDVLSDHDVVSVMEGMPMSDVLDV